MTDCSENNAGCDSWDSRTLGLIGSDGAEKLRRANVLVAGVGGVGGYAAEILARSGVGNLTIVDADRVSVSNINRQIIALRSTVGEVKTDLFARRFKDINPDIRVTAVNEFITPDNVEALLFPTPGFRGYDFVLDCIDTVAPKVALIAGCLRHDIPMASSMGAGGRMDPTKVSYADLWETKEDGLARAVRQRLRKMGLRRRLTTVCSSEAPRPSAVIKLDERNKRSSYGTLATIPAIFGIFLASRAIQHLLRHDTK